MAERGHRGQDITAAQVRERRSRNRRGRWSELAASALLIAKGYRILAWRWRSAAGEIDLIAVRGRRLAFIEVKHRATAEACEAAIYETQRRRVRRAADLWLARHVAFQTYDLAFDVIHAVPRRLPRHIEHGL